MDDSLESLLEKATNPKNKYEDWEFIMAFCDKVNEDVEGPQISLRILVPKIKNENEKVSMLSLALLEACVKNCGQRFHQELGKFKFLNELIRMISPKYLGNTTPPVVKDRIKELLYSWKVGLPHEAKINEAYLMLKREGLIFDESIVPDKTLEPEHTKPKVSLIQDPKQSQMLQKLLSSRNPEDLRAANRLIREMVRRDERRMQKLQKRLEEVELIQNNVKLLNELLIHLKEEVGEEEKQLIEELYKSIDKMRPNLFRMASELKQNEEGMSEILRTNDSVLRVMDLYKSKIGDPGATNEEGSKGGGATASNTKGGGATTSSTNTTVTTSSTSVPGDQSASKAPPPEENGATGGVDSDILIDLADLNFDTPAITTNPGATGSVPPTDLNSSLGGLGSLMDNLTALDLGTPTNTNLGILDFTSSSNVGDTQPLPLFFSGGSQPTQSLASQLPPSQPLQSSQQSSLGMGSPFGGTVPLSGSDQVSSSSSSSFQHPPPSSAKSPLISIPPPPQHPIVNPVGQIQSFGMGLGSSVSGSGNGMLGMGSQPLQVASLSGIQPSLDPLAILDNIFVPLESIKPGSLPAMPVISKNNVSLTFHFTENSPANGVAVIIISIINTSSVPISNFQFQAAVPKIMRIKLQPPTTTELGAYNPVLPPPSISQVMLLANPSKAKIRVKYKISYNQGGPEIIEMGEASNFPPLL